MVLLWYKFQKCSDEDHNRLKWTFGRRLWCKKGRIERSEWVYDRTFGTRLWRPKKAVCSLGFPSVLHLVAWFNNLSDYGAEFTRIQIRSVRNPHVTWACLISDSTYSRVIFKAVCNNKITHSHWLKMMQWCVRAAPLMLAGDYEHADMEEFKC